MVGWWSLIYSNDWQAVLHYSPVELAWFLLKHVIACGPIGQRTRFNPCITALAKESWVRLGRYFNDHGILEDRDFDPGALTSFQWPTLPTTGRERYHQYRELRQALYASATFPGIPG